MHVGARPDMPKALKPLLEAPEPDSWFFVVEYPLPMPFPRMYNGKLTVAFYVFLLCLQARQTCCLECPSQRSQHAEC